MTRSVQSKLFSKENRLTKLKQADRHDKPTFIQIASGILLGYKRSKKYGGKWYAKFNGDLINEGVNYKTMQLAIADDYAAADGVKILNLAQAQSKLHSIKKALTLNLYNEEQISIKFREAAAKYWEDYVVRKTRPSDGHKSYVDRVVNMEVPYRKAHKIKPLTLGDIRLDDISYEDLDSIKLDCAKRGRNIAYKTIKLSDTEKARRRKVTANRLVVIIKAILNYAHTNKRVTHVKNNNEWVKFKKFTDVDQPRTNWWDIDECQAWLNKCNEPSLKDFFIGAISCGFRVNEQAMLRVEDVILSSTTPHIIVRAENTKTNKERSVLIPEQYLEFYTTLVAGRDGSDVLFKYRGGRKQPHFKSGLIHQPFIKVTKAAKLQRMQWHCLRHSYASQLVNLGVPLKIVADQLGHTTTIYVEKWYGHLNNTVIKEAVDKLPVLHNLITDKASVVKINQTNVSKTGKQSPQPRLHDDKSRQAIWAKPENAEELLEYQNDPYVKAVHKARRRGETRQGWNGGLNGKKKTG